MNQLYQKTKHGGLALKAAAKTYRNDLNRRIAEDMHQLAGFPIDQETVYQLDIILYFEKLENPGWFKVKRDGERGAKTRYKVIDYDNRIKFLQDSLSKAIGIPDDCQIFGGYQEKREDKNNPRAEVTLRVRDRDYYFKE